MKQEQKENRKEWGIRCAHRHFEQQTYAKDSLRDWFFRFKTWMEVKGYSNRTIAARQHHLRYFILWCEERDIKKAQQITKPILDRFQKHLFIYKKSNGDPLSSGTQNARLNSVKAFFRWTMTENRLLFNPASELKGPKVPYVLPRSILSVSQMEEILSMADLTQPKGIRDRAIMEVFYSTGIRRIELIRLHLDDIDWSRETLFIRQGKGKKDRVVPIGLRALLWVKKYLKEVRPVLLKDSTEKTLFLTPEGEPIPPKRLTGWIRIYLKKAGFEKGACHVFRHTTATLMLENGADTRYIQQLLGHAKLETTQIYTQVSISKLKEVHQATHPAKVPEDFSLDD